MSFDSDKIESIISRSLLGCITPEEEQELDSWLKEDASHKIFYDRITDKQYIREKQKLYREIDVAQKLQQNQPMLLLKKVRYIGGRFAACAAVVLLFLGIWIFVDKPRTEK